jgi:hypothetical protein
MATITGTFSATGQSTPIVGRKVNVAMNFAGTASVDIERQMPDGDWIKVDTAITADSDQVLDYPANVAIRLNCTAYTNDVEYVMMTGPEG